MTHAVDAHAFAVFKQHANEQHDTLAQVKERIAPVQTQDHRVRALSIGTGSGEVDLPILAAVCPPQATVELHCVEPNPVHANTLRKSAQTYPQLQPPPEVSETPFEERQPFEAKTPDAALAAGQKFDLILASHSIYYFADRPSFLRKVAACLKPEGRLLLTVNEPEGLGQVHNFYREQKGAKELNPAYVGRTALRDLSLTGFTATKHRVESHVDVTPLMEGSPDGDAILSVFLDLDCRAASAPLRAAVTDFVSGLSLKKEGRTLFPQNIALIEARLAA